MMPHLERACFPWENAYYPLDRKDEDQITPWMEAFVNAASGLKHIRKHKPNSFYNDKMHKLHDTKP